MIFTQNFETKFISHGIELLLGSITSKNKVQLDHGLSLMSKESIRNRFMGTKKGFTSKELEYLTELDGWNHFALGLMEAKSAKGIAVIRMVRLQEDPKCAEVAITIIDEYQRQGFGFMLLMLMVQAAREREIETFSFSYIAQNEGIEKLISKIGPFKSVQTTQGTKHVLIDITRLQFDGVTHLFGADQPIFEEREKPRSLF